MIKIPKIKNIHIQILFLILISLIFILWGRILCRETNKKNCLENLYTTSDRINALSYFGWETVSGSELKDFVEIPESFDKMYEDYNSLQKLSGFDLSPFKGKTVEKFTYIAANFPVKTESVIYINILISNGRLIGGDCCSPALSGFLLPLDRRFSP